MRQAWTLTPRRLADLVTAVRFDRYPENDMIGRCQIAIVLALFLSLCGVSAGQPIRGVTSSKGPAIEIDGLQLAPELASVLRAAAHRADWQKAEALLAEQSSLQPDSAALLTALGSVLFHNGRYLQSAIAYNQADQIEPLDELSRFTLANAYIAMDRRHWARPELEKLAAMYPVNAVYPYWLAGVDYFYQWYGQAIAKLRTSIELDPDFAPAYDRLGQCFEGAGRADEAIAAYEKAVALNKGQGRRSPWAAWHLGSLLRDLDRLSDAERALREALRDARDLPQVHYDFGVVLRKQGKLQEAREVLLRAAELDPADPQPHYALAEVYRRSGDKEKALAELEEFRRLKGQSGTKAR